MNNYLMQKKMHLDQKTKAMIELLRESVKHEGDCIKLSKEDTLEFNRVLDSLIFMIIEYKNFIDYLGSHTGSTSANMLMAMRDNQIGDEEKMQLINSILCSLIDFYPDEWKEYFQLKINSLIDKKTENNLKVADQR